MTTYYVGEKTDAGKYPVLTAPGESIIRFSTYEAAREWARRANLEEKELVISVAEAAELAGVTVQAIRDILRDDDRRAAIFPGAYRTSNHPQRGEWRIPRAEVEAWKPRRVKTK